MNKYTASLNRRLAAWRRREVVQATPLTRWSVNNFSGRSRGFKIFVGVKHAPNEERSKNEKTRSALSLLRVLQLLQAEAMRQLKAMNQLKIQVRLRKRTNPSMST